MCNQLRVHDDPNNREYLFILFWINPFGYTLLQNSTKRINVVYLEEQQQTTLTFTKEDFPQPGLPSNNTLHLDEISRSAK